MQDIMNFKIPINKLIFDLDKHFFEGIDLFNKSENTQNILADLLGEEELNETFLKNILTLLRNFASSSDTSLEQLKVSITNEITNILKRDYITIDDIINSNEEQIKLLYSYFLSNLNNTTNIQELISTENLYESLCFIAIAFFKYAEFKLENKMDELSDILNDYIFGLINKYIDDYYLLQSKNKEINKSILEIININKNLKNENKSIKKELEISNRYTKKEISRLITCDLGKGITKFSNVLDNCIKDIKNANYKTLKNSYESLLNQSEEKISNNKLMLSEKNNEIKILKQNQLTEDNILIYIKENIGNIDLKNKILNILDISSNYNKQQTITSNYIEDININIEKESIYKNENQNKIIDLQPKKSYIGYCSISDNIHYAVLPNKKEIEINGLPTGLYLGQGQFVKIYDDGTFIKNYDYYIPNTSNFNILPDSSLIEIKTSTENDKEVYYTLINDERIEIKSINQGFIIYDNSIGVINQNNIIVRLFKKFKYNIDSLIDSILAKTHTPYFVLSTNEKTITVRNILTNEVIIYDKCFNFNREITPLSTIILDDEDNIISMFSASKFYTTSSFYENKRYINIKNNNDDIEIYDCITGDKIDVILNVSNDKLLDEQSYVIDEYGNIIDVISNNSVLLSSIEKKCRYKKQKTASETENNPIKIKKKVLIVGDKGFEKTYKINLYKYGYIVKVIDGFDSWKKIQMELKNIDVIIAVPSYMSHDNFYKIKDTLTDTDVIISAHNGANRLAELLEEKYEAVI